MNLTGAGNLEAAFKDKIEEKTLNEAKKERVSFKSRQTLYEADNHMNLTNAGNENPQINNIPSKKSLKSSGAMCLELLSEER
jgi:hypothetical protein